ncbi:MAG: hypothetical protein HFJ54_02455 [Clostridia bacterium]|nr:hypothetical protein [Clostridia bacterium]
MILIYLGINVYFSQTRVGEQGNNADNDPDTPGNHIALNINGRHGLIEWAGDLRFTEYLVNVDRNNYISSEDGTEKLFSFGEIMQPIKKELIYVQR